MERNLAGTAASAPDWAKVGRWTFLVAVVWPLQYLLAFTTALLIVPPLLLVARRTARAAAARPGVAAFAGAATGAALASNPGAVRQAATSTWTVASRWLAALFLPWGREWARGPQVVAPPPLPALPPPPPPAICPHGLSLGLCADPVNHYPLDDPGF